MAGPHNSVKPTQKRTSQRGEGQDGKSPSSLLFQPISPSSLNFHLPTACGSSQFLEHFKDIFGPFILENTRSFLRGDLISFGLACVRVAGVQNFAEGCVTEVKPSVSIPIKEIIIRVDV